jgi:hypothetical protein
LIEIILIFLKNLISAVILATSSDLSRLCFEVIFYDESLRALGEIHSLTIFLLLFLIEPDSNNIVSCKTFSVYHDINRFRRKLVGSGALIYFSSGAILLLKEVF